MKHAIVTGGAGLIGAELCRALFAAGYRVTALDQHELPEDVEGLVCDVADPESVTRAFDAIEGPVDLLVNCAGMAGPHRGPLAALSVEDWRRIVDSHLTGAFLVSRAAIPRMVDGGSIVNIASTRAFQSEPDSEAYAAAKGGLVALTHAMAISLGPQLRVNAIAPGWISSGEGLSEQDHAQHPVGRVGMPWDVAEAVLYLAEAGFMTGQVLVLDGGMTRKMIYAE